MEVVNLPATEAGASADASSGDNVPGLRMGARAWPPQRDEVLSPTGAASKPLPRTKVPAHLDTVHKEEAAAAQRDLELRVRLKPYMKAKQQQDAVIAEARAASEAAVAARMQRRREEAQLRHLQRTQASKPAGERAKQTTGRGGRVDDVLTASAVGLGRRAGADVWCRGTLQALA